MLDDWRAHWAYLDSMRGQIPKALRQNYRFLEAPSCRHAIFNLRVDHEASGGHRLRLREIGDAIACKGSKQRPRAVLVDEGSRYVQYLGLPREERLSFDPKDVDRWRHTAATMTRKNPELKAKAAVAQVSIIGRSRK